MPFFHALIFHLIHTDSESTRKAQEKHWKSRREARGKYKRSSGKAEEKHGESIREAQEKQKIGSGKVTESIRKVQEK